MRKKNRLKRRAANKSMQPSQSGTGDLHLHTGGRIRFLPSFHMFRLEGAPDKIKKHRVFLLVLLLIIITLYTIIVRIINKENISNLKFYIYAKDILKDEPNKFMAFTPLLVKGEEKSGLKNLNRFFSPKADTPFFPKGEKPETVDFAKILSQNLKLQPIKDGQYTWTIYFHSRGKGVCGKKEGKDYPLPKIFGQTEFDDSLSTIFIDILKLNCFTKINFSPYDWSKKTNSALDDRTHTVEKKIEELLPSLDRIQNCEGHFRKVIPRQVWPLLREWVDLEGRGLNADIAYAVGIPHRCNSKRSDPFFLCSPRVSYKPSQRDFSSTEPEDILAMFDIDLGPFYISLKSHSGTLLWSKKVDLHKGLKNFNPKNLQDIIDLFAMPYPKNEPLLEPGHTYYWSVSHYPHIEENPRYSFRVLSIDEQNQLKALERQCSNSHLLLFHLYKSLGLRYEAFQQWSFLWKQNDDKSGVITLLLGMFTGEDEEVGEEQECSLCLLRAVEEVVLGEQGKREPHQEAVQPLKELGKFDPANQGNPINLVKADLQGANLKGAFFNEANLAQANLSGAILSHANLYGAILEQANLSNADLHKADLRGADLHETDLQADLRQAHLSRANLRKANLCGANLEDVNLEGADLYRANLRGADLEKACLTGCCLAHSNLEKAKLADVKLSGAILKGTNLAQADLSGADLKGAIIDQTTHIDRKWRLVWELVNQVRYRLPQADLTGANLKDADLSHVVLTEADLRGANLTRTNFQKASLVKANLAEVSLWEVNLQGANLEGGNLEKAELTLGTLKRACLSRANLREAKLEKVNLEGANLTQADLSDAILKEVDLRGADLRKADLTRANLKGAVIDKTTKIDRKWRLVWELVKRGGAKRKLCGVDLSYANLSGANLSRGDLRRVNLGSSNLSDTNLSGANLSGANLWGAGMERANLRGADLRKAVLSVASLDKTNLIGADLRGVDLTFAYLKGAIINDTTQMEGKGRLAWELLNQGGTGRNLVGANLALMCLDGIDLKQAKLNQADLRGASLHFVNLYGTSLVGANLRGTILEKANLRGADLRKANLAGSYLREADLSEGDLRGANLYQAELDGVKLQGTKYDTKTRWANGFDPRKYGAILLKTSGM